jgi:hypothetical protein
LSDLLRVDLDVDDVGERNVEFAFECPELMQALDFEGDTVIVDRDVDHGCRA